MLDYFENLRTLFNTDQFYLIEADAKERTISYGTLEDPKELYHGKTIEEALKLINEHRAETENSSPILFYTALEHVSRAERMPYFALLDSGEYTYFHKGHYLKPANSKLSKEIIDYYLSQKDATCYKGNWKECKATCIRNSVLTTIKHLLGSDSFYAVGKYYVSKFEKGKLIIEQSTERGDINNKIFWIMYDKEKNENDYPIVFFDGHQDDGSGGLDDNMPHYVYYSDGKIDCFRRGYYIVKLKWGKEPWRLEQAIEDLYEIELSRIFHLNFSD